MPKHENKNAYDLTVLLEEDNSSFVKDLIEKSGGTDIDSEMDKMNFAYEVEGAEQGFMGVFRFWMPSSATEELKESLRSNRNILRYLLLRDNLKEKDVDQSSQKTRPKAEKSTKPKKSEEETLTNEAIEQKIEEIME